MHFESINPRDSLKDLIKEVWIYENDDEAPLTQKIIPDGFSEIILHYGDSYKINLTGKWEIQSPYLFSSQISKYFYLQNTGVSGMIGIKLFPTTFFEVFDISVERFTDKIMPLEEVLNKLQFPCLDESFKGLPNPEKILLLENWIEDRQPSYQHKVREITKKIMDHHGMITMDKIADEIGLSLRQAERLFKKVVGVTPKFFSRIIRFNHIFKTIETKNASWIRVALQSGYFDQSHFIKNFKEFTGEEPSNYGFEEKNLANFFLKG